MSNKTQQEVETIYEIVVEGKRIKGTSNGRSYDFIAFDAYDTNGKKSNIKFTKAVKGVPETEGTYKVLVNKKDINKDKSSKYPTYWIKGVVSITEFEPTFDNSEDLPF